MANGPPTPPPADAIEMDDETRTTSSSMLQTAESSTDVPETSTSTASTVGGSPRQQTQETPAEATPSSAIYQKYIPKLLDHSASLRFSELIDDAVRADLAQLDGDHELGRLQITIPLVLSYMITDDLPLARSALRRMNHFFRDIPIVQTLGSLLVAVSGRDYAQIYNRAEALVDFVTLPSFPSRDLGRIIHNIVPNFVNHFRSQTLLLLTRAYTSLPMRLAVVYIGLPPDKVQSCWSFTHVHVAVALTYLAVMTVNGWTYDPTTETFVPPKGKSKGPTASTLVQAQAVASDGSSVIETEAEVARSTTHLNAVGEEERWVTLQFSWSGKPYSLDIADSDRVFDLKTAIHDLTRVPPERQKILGLVKGKLPPDQGRISELKLVTGKKFTLLGTPEGDEIKDPSQLADLPDVVNDLDFDFTQDPAAVAAYKNDQRNIRKVKEASEKLNVNVIHPLREGKKLLVLDIDYTILDTKPLTSGSLPPAECARPGLHEFLEAVYPYYDMLDKTCMFTVFSERDGKEWQHSVKALQIIWNHFPQFNASNTIHIDDLSRNFALNPQSGLKIHAFKNAHTPQSLADRELWKLSRYLIHIANLPDFKTVSHKAWKEVAKSLPPS
ncbi:hypothetical protein V5O48_013921 [Marasmius crinis-equi]|uniref:Ubiquitin-like domain-containing protein n=1 Tax=Marasmius crinis-equi TaxID=585013 RepID=A0ABR3EZ65_9AGAR